MGETREEMAARLAREVIVSARSVAVTPAEAEASPMYRPLVAALRRVLPVDPPLPGTLQVGDWVQFHSGILQEVTEGAECHNLRVHPETYRIREVRRRPVPRAAWAVSDAGTSDNAAKWAAEVRRGVVGRARGSPKGDAVSAGTLREVAQGLVDQIMGQSVFDVPAIRAQRDGDPAWWQQQVQALTDLAEAYLATAQRETREAHLADEVEHQHFLDATMQQQVAAMTRAQGTLSDEAIRWAAGRAEALWDERERRRRARRT